MSQLALVGFSTLQLGGHIGILNGCHSEHVKYPFILNISATCHLELKMGIFIISLGGHIGFKNGGHDVCWMSEANPLLN